MKHKSKVLLIAFALLLAACTGASPVATETTVPPTAPPTAAPTDTPTETPPTGGDLPPRVSFDPSLYRDNSFGFEFDYPSQWSLSDYEEQASRSSIKQLELDGVVQLQVALYLWSPAGDLDAYVASRKEAWDASGFTIASESEMDVDGYGRGIAFQITTTEGTEAFFFITVIGERYLQLSGDGDLALLAEIAGTLRPVDCLADGIDTSEWVACSVMDALRTRNLSAMHDHMGDAVILAFWQSEGYEDTPEGATSMLAANWLPADPNSPLTFTAGRDEFPPLAGQDPGGMFGPDVNIALIIYSEGWGTDGLGAALLYFAEDESGNYYLHGFVLDGEHFDK